MLIYLLFSAMVVIITCGYLCYRYNLDRRVQEHLKPRSVQLYPKKEKLKKWQVCYDLKWGPHTPVHYTEYFQYRWWARYQAWRTWRLFDGGTITLTCNRRR